CGSYPLAGHRDPGRPSPGRKCKMRLCRPASSNGLIALALVAAVTLCGGRPSLAGWRPAPGQRVDIQLLAPFGLVPPADIVALPLFGTMPARLDELRRRGTAAVCYLMAGAWESWRPDSGQFPQPVIGRPMVGHPDQRWLDIRQAALRPVLEQRLDLCRD